MSDQTEREAPADMDADLYNRLVPFLMSRGREGLLLAEEIKNIFGASARRRRAVLTPAIDPDDEALVERCATAIAASVGQVGPLAWAKQYARAALKEASRG